ncbi:MAG: hypothetical protein KGZ69_15065 [Methylomonas sp.]|nr:hypothetical protein [Methylomonas sp.]
MKFKTKRLLPVLVVFSHNCHAFDWLFEPNFGASERYTDNLRMQIEPIRDNLITRLSPGVLLGYMAENHALNADFKWNELIYHGESELDFSEKIADISQKYTGERFAAGLSARYAEQSTINTQLDLDGSGDLQVQIPKTTRSVAPNITYNLTERDALQFSYNYTDVGFTKSPGLNLSRNFSDYTNQQFSSSLMHTFSERLSVNLSGAYVEFSSSGENPTVSNPFPTTSSFSQKSSTLNYQAGVQYSFDERTRFSVSAGIRDTDTERTSRQTIDFLGLLPNSTTTSVQSSKSSGNVFSANFDHKFDWGSLDISAGRQLTPASTGGQRNTTNFSASLKYNLAERWTSGITATYLLSESATATAGDTTNNNRTYITLSPNIRWRWTPEINLELSYIYRQQEFESLNQTSVGNNLQLQFSYQPQINRQVK